MTVDKRAKQQVARQAATLPPLPETASALAVELHQRADAMLRVRLDNIEVYVNNLVDQAVGEVVRRAMEPAITARVSDLVKERLSAVSLPGFDQALAEVVASMDLRKDWLREITNHLSNHVWKLLQERVAQIAPTVAERLARDALEEVQRYYGAAGILAADGGSK